VAGSISSVTNQQSTSATPQRRPKAPDGASSGDQKLLVVNGRCALAGEPAMSDDELHEVALGLLFAHGKAAADARGGDDFLNWSNAYVQALRGGASWQEAGFTTVADVSVDADVDEELLLPVDVVLNQLADKTEQIKAARRAVSSAWSALDELADQDCAPAATFMNVRPEDSKNQTTVARVVGHARHGKQGRELVLVLFSVVADDPRSLREPLDEDVMVHARRWVGRLAEALFRDHSLPNLRNKLGKNVDRIAAIPPAGQ
jgi:hypothetical protein